MKPIQTIVGLSLLNFFFVFATLILWNTVGVGAPVPVAPSRAGEPAPSAPAAPTTPAAPPALAAAPKPAAPSPKPAAPAPAPKPPPPVDNRCIITIQDKRYDVTQFRNQHSGGDIFTCGTDMTAIFFGQHDQRLLDTTMRQFLVPS